MAGFACNNCVLFTANDAYMRDYELAIPADCTASIRATDKDNALKQMHEVLKADIRSSPEIKLPAASRSIEQAEAAHS